MTRRRPAGLDSPGRPLTRALLVAAALALAAPAAGQEGDGIGVAVGLGGGYFAADGTGNAEGIAAMGELSYRTGPHLFSARGAAIAEILGDGMADFGLLYGRRRDAGASHLSVSAGVGLAFFEDCPLGIAIGFCRTDFALGVPVALRASWRPSRFFGLGVQALGNVNTGRSFAAGALYVEAGRLR